MTDQKVLKAVISVELGNEKIRLSLIDEAGAVLLGLSAPTPQRTTRAAVAEIARLAVEAASSGRRGNHIIEAVALSTPGLVDPDTSRVTIPELRGWTRVPLREMLEEALAETGHDIRTSSAIKRARAQHRDSAHPAIKVFPRLACLAAGETVSGSARGKKDVVYVEIDQLIRAGIISKGRVLEGASGNSGAAGWMALSEVFKHGYESAGCLAIEAGKASLPRRAIEEWSGSQNTMLGKIIKSDPQHLDAGDIVRAARGGDRLAVEVVHETCRWLGRSIASLISILNPEAVVIGGEMGLSLKAFIDSIRAEAAKWSFPPAFKDCKITVASAGETAEAVGAAKLARG